MTNSDLEKLNKIERIADFISAKISRLTTKIKHKNRQILLINGRNPTNIGLFRNYVQSYLEHHPALNQKLTLMCQLNPTAQGTPPEIMPSSTKIG